MEKVIIGEWKLVSDAQNLGERKKWYDPSHFPTHFQLYKSPAFFLDTPFKNTKQAWIKKEFSFQREQTGYVYLVFFGADKGKVWLNGKLVGNIKRLAKKQVFDITRQIRNENILIIKFEDIKEQHTLGIWKYIYIIENSSVPSIAKMSINHSPKWLDSAVIYSIYTRNFSDRGTFQKVIQKLPLIKSLGVNTLWLLPIHPIGEKSRKGSLGSPYAIKDYYAVNPELGTKDDFRRLVDTAHSMNMRVIIDLVINHTSPDSVMKQIDLQFYKSPDKRNSVSWRWTDVEELDYSYPPTRQYIRDMMAYWVKEFDIDGYRCDVASLVPLDFWKDAISHIRSIKPDILMLAEADNPELYLCGFDLTYDWSYLWLMLNIDKGYYRLSDIADYILTQYEYYPQNSRRMIFLENHDTQRAVSSFSKKYLCPFHILKFFIPGTPLIYNGEEIGAVHTPSLFETDPIEWHKANITLKHLFRKLSRLKQRYPSLNYHHLDGINFYNDMAYFKITRVGNDHELELIIDKSSLDIYLMVGGKIRKVFKNYF